MKIARTKEHRVQSVVALGGILFIVTLLVTACSNPQSATAGSAQTPTKIPSVAPPPPSPGTQPTDNGGTATANTGQIGGTPAPTTSPSGITATDLAQHSSESDCWAAYKGRVYDMTPWLPRHPGGVTSISRYCGTADGFTQALLRQHGTRMDSRIPNVATDEGVYVG